MTGSVLENTDTMDPKRTVGLRCKIEELATLFRCRGKEVEIRQQHIKILSWPSVLLCKRRE